MRGADLSSTITSAAAQTKFGAATAAAAASKIGKLTTGSQEVQDAVRPLLKMQAAEELAAVKAEANKAKDDNLGNLIDKTA